MSEPTPELRELRTEIAEIDRAVLEALNRRLELVMRVREHKQDAGTRFVDAEREAELLGELAALNHGPLSDRAVRSLFSAVLDVMKQETAEEPRRAAPAATAPASLGIERLAVVGTGLVGTSVALAAKRAGVKTVSGFDADAATLREAAARGAFDTQAASLADALGGAELVVVAVPVGAAVEMTRAALAAAGPDATVTDVASTKRALAAAIDDPRFVAGHPVAGRRDRRPGARRGRPVRRRHVVRDADRVDRCGAARRRRAVRDRARRATGPPGRRRARPAARAHEPPPARARQPADRPRRRGGRGRTRRRSSTRAHRSAT